MWPGVVDVRPTAQLDRVVADLDHAHEVAVLLAEQRDRALALGLLERRLVDRHLRRPARGLGVRELLGLLEHLERDRRVVREVEAQPPGRDQRPRLAGVLARAGA